jgi:hypothetical protein
MAGYYGTAKGIQNRIHDYADLVTAGSINTDRLDQARVSGDAEIHTYLAMIVSLDNLPLVNMNAVTADKINTISDDFATYYLLYDIFTQKDENISAWVQGFWDRAMFNLDSIRKNPDILGAALSLSTGETTEILGDGEDADAIFGMRRTKDGSDVTGDYEENQNTRLDVGMREYY